MLKRLLIFLIVIGIGLSIFAQPKTKPPRKLLIQEEDGSPSGRFKTLKVTNGDLTDNGDNTASLATASSVTAPTLDSVLTAGDTSATNSLTLTAGTLTAEQLTSTDDITMQGHLLTLGNNTAADVILSFLGNTADGEIKWDEGSDEFDVADDMQLQGDIHINKELIYAATQGGVEYGRFYSYADDGLHFGIGNDAAGANRCLVFVDDANYSNDYDHSSLLTHPTIFLHSATAAATATDQWLSLAHTTTTAEIKSGKGEISFDNENLTTTGTITANTAIINTLLDVNEDIDIDLDAADEEINITQSSDTGTEDVPLIFIDDDRTGATANELGEATLRIDSEGVYAMYIQDGSTIFGDRVYIWGHYLYFGDDRWALFGGSEDVKFGYDSNGTGDDLMVFNTILMHASNETSVLFMADVDPSNMTAFDNYLSPTLVIANNNGADTNDFAAVVIGEHTQADVATTHYFDFYAMTDAADGSTNATTTEVGATFRFGDSKTAADNATGAGDIVFNDDVEIDGKLYLDGGLESNEGTVEIWKETADPYVKLSVGNTLASPTEYWVMKVDNSDNDKFKIKDSDTTALTIDNSGNVGIGTTAPASLLSVGGAGNSDYAIYGKGTYGVFGYGNEYDFYAAGPGTDYGTSSSIRWKTNITEIPDALDKVLSLKGVYFNWDEEHGGQHDIGMIAEETGKYVPEVVGYEDKSIESNHYIDKDGEDRVYASGMDYGALMPLIIEAVKEQQEQIDELKSDGINDDSSYWLCTAADCSASCQLDVNDGIIVGCN